MDLMLPVYPILWFPRSADRGQQIPVLALSEALETCVRRGMKRRTPRS